MLFADVGVYKWLINPNWTGILWRKIHAQKDFSLNGVFLVSIDQYNGEVFADGHQSFLEDKGLQTDEMAWRYGSHFTCFLNQEMVYYTAIPRLTKIIRSGITFVSRNLR